MLISRTVTVKSKVTPSLRAQLGVEIQRALRDVDGDIANLTVRLKKAPEKDRGRFEGEMRELEARKENLLRQLKDVAKFADGQELSRGQIEGFYDLKVGDPWPDVLACEVVIEDGRVVAIREGSSVTALILPGAEGEF